MIELRWLVVHDYKKLQYRQQVDTTIRAGLWSNEDKLKTSNYQWSDWQDVPEVGESITPIKTTCPKCGLAFIGAMSYTCPESDCPTGFGSAK